MAKHKIASRALLKRADPPPRQEQTVHNTVIREHPRHEQKRYELRNGDRNNEDRSEEALESNPLFIDHNRHDHTEEIVRKGRKKCPNERPDQDLPEGVAEFRSACRFSETEQRLKVIKPHPGKECSRRLMLRIVIRKRNQDHKNDRQYRKDQNTRKRERKQSFVELPVR